MLILASSSLRRKEILSYFSMPFKICSPNFDEKTIEFNDNPKDYAIKIALEKAKLVSQTFPNDTILSADTIVYCEKKLFGKPESEKEAMQILKILSGSWHEVYTGVAVYKNNTFYTDCEITRVRFHPLTEKQIALYHSAFCFSDTAGGYAIQKSGGIIVRYIEGCYYNVMGLPINTTCKLLKLAGIDLWEYLKPV